MEPVICPYCNELAKLTDSSIVYGKSYGMIWDCRPCDAYVGTHKNSKNHAPLGRLANKLLREWKKRAHAAFDPLWRGSDGIMSRKEAYQWMQESLSLEKESAHIGKFDVEKCVKLVSLLKKNFVRGVA